MQTATDNLMQIASELNAAGKQVKVTVLKPRKARRSELIMSSTKGVRTNTNRRGQSYTGHATYATQSTVEGNRISQDYSSMVNFARCKVLGANVLRGPNQIPWDGKLNYDYQLWIDSDIVFDTNKFWQLMDLALPENGEEKEIAAGWYATEDGHTTSVAHWLDEEDFAKNGGVMNHETVESITRKKKPFTVDYTGFGWVLIKKGVFERLEYPWFAPKMQVFDSGKVQDMCGEDVSFCLDAKKEGIVTWCDPRIRVGHEKTRII